MQHLQSLKSENREMRVMLMMMMMVVVGGDRRKEREGKRMDQWFHFKGTQTSSLHTVTTRSWQQIASPASLSARRDRTLNHNSVCSGPEKMTRGGNGGRGGGDRGERKSIRLSAFTADTQSRFVILQLPPLHCHIHKYIFEFILNLIHLSLRPLRC